MKKKKSMFKQLLADVKGKKTYAVCAVTALYAVAGVYLGFLGPQEALALLFAAMGGASLRNASK